MASPAKRSIPPVHRFTTDPSIASYHCALGPSTVKSIVQSVLDDCRSSSADVPTFDALRDRVSLQLASAEAHGLLPVINGTGVLLHTNFGRAPLSTAALAAVARLGAGYTNLEYDLVGGARGDRHDRLVAQIRDLSGAEAALVVNNCAAAVLLVLDTFARGREVVVSRGELIEIGGGFRLPEVLEKSGAALVEVGTTNKTYAGDYRNAWTPATALFMRTHPSNYRVAGFTAEVDSHALAALARELAVLSFEDLGSGALVDLTRFGLVREPTLADEIAAGFDLVAVSGDKLLGGPQCGVIAGRAECIDRLKRNPLLRALRVDKLTIAALSATLADYCEPERLTRIPLFAMLKATPEDLLVRARAIAARLASPTASGVAIEPARMRAATGGGTLPLQEIPSAGIAIRASGRSAPVLAEALRSRRPPVIGRIEGDALLVDLRTVRSEEDAALLDALASL